MVQAPPQDHFLEDEVEVQDDEDAHHCHVLYQVLQPNSNNVHEALSKVIPNNTIKGP